LIVLKQHLKQQLKDIRDLKSNVTSNDSAETLQLHVVNNKALYYLSH